MELRGRLQITFVPRRAKMMPGTMGNRKLQEGVAAIGDTLDGAIQNLSDRCRKVNCGGRLHDSTPHKASTHELKTAFFAEPH